MTPAAQLLRPENAALIVIDLQEKLMPAIWEKERVIKNVTKLLRLTSILKMKALPTTQYTKGLGDTIPEIASLLPESPIDKTSLGCLGDERIRQKLESAVPRGYSLLVAGIETHICVTQTVLGALAAGYNVHVV